MKKVNIEVLHFEQVIYGIKESCIVETELFDLDELTDYEEYEDLKDIILEEGEDIAGFLFDESKQGYIQVYKSEIR